MRIALAAAGSRGDVHPAISLGGLLAARGHAVRVCTPPDFADDVRAAGLEHREVGTSVRALLERNAVAIGSGPGRTVRAALRELRALIDGQFAKLPEAVGDCELVVGAGLQLAGHSVAASRGVPYRFLAYCPNLIPSRAHPPFMVPWQELPGTLNALLWWASRHGFGALLRGPLDHHRRLLGLPLLGDVYAHLASPRPILALDAQIAQAPADAPFDVQQVPGLHPFAPAPLPEKLDAFLDAGPPPVYVGFGSMPDNAPERTTRLILRAAERAGVRVVIGGGWAGLGQVPLPESAMAVGSVPHAALFPRCAVVVHHGGAGTTTTAARSGVPQVVVPHLLDQFYFARRMRDLGVAPIAIERRKLSVQLLSEALEALVGNEFLAERARALGGRLRDALATPFDPESLLRG